MRYLLNSLLLLCLFQPTLAAEPVPLEMEVAFADGDFTPEQGDDLSFRPYVPGTPLETESSDSGMVLRVRMPRDTSPGRSKNLIVQPHYLWHVTGWFKYEDRQQWNRVVVGRLLSPAADYYSTRDLVFEIEGHLEEGTPVYLHITDTRKAKPVHASLVDRHEYLIEDVAFSRLIATVYGMTFVLALANLLFYFFVRDKSFLFYSIYMFLVLNMMVWQEGWIGRLISLDGTVWDDRALRLFAGLPMLAYYSFFRQYLGLSGKEWSGRFLIGVQAAIGVLLVASLGESIALGSYVRHSWIGLSNGVLAIGAVGVSVVTLVAWIRGNRLALYLFVANLVLVTATLMRIYYAFTFDPDGYWWNHAFEVAVAIDAILLSLAVADRTLSIRRERDEVKVDFERIDTAYKREQMLTEFVRAAKALATDHESPGFSAKLDDLMYRSINRVIDAQEVVLLSREGTEFTHRILGGEKIIDRASTGKRAKDLSQLLENCSQGKVVSGHLPGHSDPQKKFKYVLIPVRLREQMDYCVMLVVPSGQSLDKELVSGLREFIEKAVHARLDAENMSKLQHSATYDDLTGVLNRASMEEHASRVMKECSNAGRGLSLAFVDIDDFKALNDTMGHDFGDQCLRILCLTMRDVLPVDAAIGRFGGDEFLVLLPGADYFHATERLASLNPALQEQMIDSEASLSVSIGIAEFPSGEKMSLAQLLKKADLSLYSAKAAGRGCIGANVDGASVS